MGLEIATLRKLLEAARHLGKISQGAGVEVKLLGSLGKPAKLDPAAASASKAEQAIAARTPPGSERIDPRTADQVRIRELARCAMSEFPDDIIHTKGSINGRKTANGRRINGVEREPEVWVEDRKTRAVKKTMRSRERTSMVLPGISKVTQ